jgi:RHS repeat-associated protein
VDVPVEDDLRRLSLCPRLDQGSLEQHDLLHVHPGTDSSPTDFPSDPTIVVDNYFDTGGRLIRDNQRLPLNGALTDHDVLSVYRSDGFRSTLTYPQTYSSGGQALERYELTMAPDGLGRLASVTGPQLPSEPAVGAGRGSRSLLTYSYLGDKVWQRWSGNGLETQFYETTPTTHPLYDGVGRVRGMRSVDAGNGNPLIADFRYGYDRVGNRTYEQRRHEAMTAPSAGFRTRTYKTDLLGRLTRQREKALGADTMTTPIVPMDDGDPTDATPASPDGSTAALDGEAWTLDLLGNWTDYTDGLAASPTKAFSINARNQYATIDPDGSGSGSPVTVDYTWLGEIWKDRDRDRKYEWDAFGRMTKVYQGAETSALIATYRYDAFNRRVEKTVEAAYVTGDRVTRFVYDGWRAVEERGVTGTSPNQREVVRARYGFGNGLDELIWMDRDLSPGSTAPNGSVESRYDIAQDALGSAVAATAERAATSDPLVVAEHYTYSAYGSVQVWTGAWLPQSGTYAGGYQNSSTIGLPYLYTGQRQDYETRLYYYKNRYFDPVMGRFLSRDPLGLAAGPNIYAYAMSAPSMLTDPLGLLSDELRRQQSAGHGADAGHAGDVFRPLTAQSDAKSTVTGISAAFGNSQDYGDSLLQKASTDPSSLSEDERRDLIRLVREGTVSAASTLALRLRYARTTKRVYFESAGFFKTSEATNDSITVTLNEIETFGMDNVTEWTDALGNGVARISEANATESDRMYYVGLGAIALGGLFGQPEVVAYGVFVARASGGVHLGGTIATAIAQPSMDHTVDAVVESFANRTVGQLEHALGAELQDAAAKASMGLAGSAAETSIYNGLQGLYGGLVGMVTGSVSLPPQSAPAAPLCGACSIQ